MKDKKKVKIKKISKKTMLAFIICALTFSIIGVGASTLLYSKDVTYDNTSSGLSATTVQEALDELYEKAKSNSSEVQNVNCDDAGNCTITCKQGDPTITNNGYSCTTTTTTTETVTCPSGTFYKALENGFICSSTSLTTLSLGDYVSMTPTLTSYQTNPSYTGSNIQTINPSELNLWRVIHKNEDGTVDMVSEYTSSSYITFYGSTGFLNIVGQLNLLASAYENNTYTSGSRHMGYKNQIEFCSSLSSCPNDTDYSVDTNYVQEALGTLIAYKVNATNKPTYFLASREKRVYSSEVYYSCNYVYSEGSGDTLYYTYYSSGESYGRAYYLRPIVTLKSTLKISGGSGTASRPYTLSAS